MPRAAHTVLTWKGTFGTLTDTFEEWQFSLRAPVAAVAQADSATQQTFADELLARWKTHLAGIHPGHVYVRSAEFRTIGDNGRQTKDASGAYSGTKASTGGPGGGTGANTPILPPQCATVISLTTAKAGARGKGRIYFPTTAGALGTDLRFTAVQQDTVAGAAQAFLNSVNTLLGPDNIAVFSFDGTPGAPVTGLKVGRAVDTQRRRRGDMLEAYIARPVSP